MWTYPRRRRRCYRIITTFFFFFLFWVLPIRAEERGELVVTDGEVQKKKKNIVDKKISGGRFRDVKRHVARFIIEVVLHAFA